MSDLKQGADPQHYARRPFGPLESGSNEPQSQGSGDVLDFDGTTIRDYDAQQITTV